MMETNFVASSSGLVVHVAATSSQISSLSEVSTLETPTTEVTLHPGVTLACSPLSYIAASRSFRQAVLSSLPPDAIRDCSGRAGNACRVL